MFFYTTVDILPDFKVGKIVIESIPGIILPGCYQMA